jgi:hypothetical protein
MTASVITTEGVVSASATTVPRLRLVHTSAEDPATRAWERGSRGVPREHLLEAAREKLSRLMRLASGWDGHRGEPTTLIAAMVTNGLLTKLVQDDGPTPQLLPSPDGGVQVEWLVSGFSVHVDVDPAGEVLAAADEPTGSEIFSDEFPYWAPNAEILARCRVLLREMAEHLERRLPYNAVR